MNLKLIIKGFIVGLGKIIPGVSGSLFAFSLGIYENLIEAITHFFDNPKTHFKLLFNFSLGVFISIIFFSKIILYFLNNYYNATMYLFLGLILGTSIPFIKKVKFTKKNNIIFLITLSLMLLLPLIHTSNNFIFNGSIIHYIYTSFLGLIDAFSSILPGVSGTAIFMLLGSYEYVLTILSNPFSLVFIIYVIGLVIGLIIICYIMNYLLKNKKEETYSLILAFMIGSIFLLFLKLLTTINIFLILIFLIGLINGYLFDK